MSDIPELLLSHFEDPYHRGCFERATHAAQVLDADSQHFVVIQLRVNDSGIVEEAWFDARGCLACEAPASILTQFCESKSIVELIGLTDAQFAELTQLERLSSKSNCRQLAWHALQKALQSTDEEFDCDRLTFGGPSLGEET